MLKVFGVVRLTGEPETRKVGDTTVTNVNAVHNERVKVDGEWTSKPVWIRLSVWGSRGETFGKFLGKGDLVQIEGRLRVDQDTGNPAIWYDNDGNAHSNIEVTVSEWDFCGKGSGKGSELKTAKETAEEIPWD